MKLVLVEFYSLSCTIQSLRDKYSPQLSVLRHH